MQTKHEKEINAKAIMKFQVSALFFLVISGMATGIGLAQDRPADNMEILRAKFKADKKLLVATDMELTESETKGFWPVYEEYQRQLAKINARLLKNRESYAADYRVEVSRHLRPRRIDVERRVYRLAVFYDAQEIAKKATTIN
jgi:hypothetical protein